MNGQNMFQGAVIVVIGFGVLASLFITYGQAGILSPVQGAFAAISAYTTASLMSHYGIPPCIGLIVGLLVPAMVGYLGSWFLPWLSSLMLAPSTLPVSDGITALIQHGGDVTCRLVGIVRAPPPFFDPVQSGWKRRGGECPHVLGYVPCRDLCGSRAMIRSTW